MKFKLYCSSLIFSFAIKIFSNASPPSKIFLRNEIVEVVVSSLTNVPWELLSLLSDLKVVVREFVQSFEERDSSKEFLAAANL